MKTQLMFKLVFSQEFTLNILILALVTVYNDVTSSSMMMLEVDGRSPKATIIRAAGTPKARA